MQRAEQASGGNEPAQGEPRQRQDGAKDGAEPMPWGVVSRQLG